MKFIRRTTQSTRRRFLITISSALLSGCMSTKIKDAPQLSDEERRIKDKFRGISGVVLRLDSSTPRSNVSIKASDGSFVDCPASLSLRTVHNLTYARGNYPIPKTIEVTWRVEATRYQGQCKYRDDKVLGTATVPVADRYPRRRPRRDPGKWRGPADQDPPCR